MNTVNNQAYRSTIEILNVLANFFNFVVFSFARKICDVEKVKHPVEVGVPERKEFFHRLVC